MSYLKKYGITQADYDRMLSEQFHCCKICGKHQSLFKRKFAVDHCHQTLRVRGLLCFRCNKFVVGTTTLATAAALIRYVYSAYPEIHEELQDLTKKP